MFGMIKTVGDDKEHILQYVRTLMEDVEITHQALKEEEDQYLGRAFVMLIEQCDQWEELINDIRKLCESKS